MFVKDYTTVLYLFQNFRENLACRKIYANIEEIWTRKQLLKNTLKAYLRPSFFFSIDFNWWRFRWFATWCLRSTVKWKRMSDFSSYRKSNCHSLDVVVIIDNPDWNFAAVEDFGEFWFWGWGGRACVKDVSCAADVIKQVLQANRYI